MWCTITCGAVRLCHFASDFGAVFAVSGGYLKFPLTIWVVSRQEPCSSIGWHFLVFLIKRSNVQIPLFPNYWIIKKFERWVISLLFVDDTLIFTLSRMMIHWMWSYMDSGGWNEFQQCWCKEPIVDNIIYVGNETQKESSFE